MAVVQLLRKSLRLSNSLSLSFRMMSSSQGNSSALHTYETLKVSQARDKVLHVELYRPEKRNAMNQAFWREMVECFNRIAQDSDCHAVVLSGAGKVFTAGLDLMDFASTFMQKDSEDPARIAWHARKKIMAYQETFSVLEKCTKPVIVAFHGACVGGGVDLITACDIRYCTQDAWIQVKEVDIGLAADVGTLQRLPRVIGNQSLVNELVYTARKMMSEEAKSCGLVSRVFESKDAMLEGAFEVASEIASKSPVAVQGTKLNLVYSRDHSVPESLNYMATWNMSMLQSEDLVKSAMASIEKKTPRDVVYSKL